MSPLRIATASLISIPDAKFLQLPSHLRLVVIAQGGDDTVACTDTGKNSAQPRIHAIARAFPRKPVIPRHHAKVNFQISDAVHNDLGKPLQTVNVQIGQMQYSEAIEAAWQMVGLEPKVADDRRERVAHSAGVQPHHLQRKPHERRCYLMSKQKQIALSSFPIAATDAFSKSSAGPEEDAEVCTAEP